MADWSKVVERLDSVERELDGRVRLRHRIDPFGWSRTVLREWRGRRQTADYLRARDVEQVKDVGLAGKTSELVQRLDGSRSG